MAFYECKKLKYIDFDSNKINFKKYRNNLFIGKSDMNSDIFDRIFYSNRNIQQAIIPSFIKVISGNAFANC